MSELTIMVSMDLLSEGQKIALIFQKDANMVEMICVIERVLDDRLELQLPQYFMRYVECLGEGASLTAKVFTKMGTIDFNTIVITSPLDDDDEPFSIELDYNALILTPGAEMPTVGAMERLEVYGKDGVQKLKTFELSTEYMKFYSDAEYEIGEEIDCVIFLPEDYGTIKFKAAISEIDPVYSNEITAVYTMMTEQDRQSLLYYMYLYSIDETVQE